MSNKLGGIYQALDSGNNKQALKLCNALLTKKKDENTNAVIILKAITLAKLGENNEAIKVADEIAFTGISNETLLSNLNYFYKSVQQTQKMTNVYEAATKKYPNNEMLAQGCFLAYAKVRDYDLQKQMVINLQKNFPSEQHTFWYLMTYLTISAGSNDINSTNYKLSIGLAQKCAEKLLADGKFKNSEQLNLYESVLELQNKTNEHLELIKSKSGELYTVATERLKILGSLYQKLGSYQDAANSFAEILTKYEPDEWSCYIGYFDSIWSLNDISKIDDAKEFIQQRQQSSSSKHLLRGPFIAEIEIYYRLISSSTVPASDAVFGKFLGLIEKYFIKFGTKPVLVQDLKKYLHYIETVKSLEVRKELLGKIKELISTKDDEDEDKSSSTYISQLSNYYKIQRTLGLQSSLTLVECDEIIEQCIQAYSNNTKKYPLSIESERYPGDDLILICYFLLLDQYQISKDISLLIQSAAILEFGHSISTRNYQFNLYLLSLYFELGAHQLANNHFKILNIKNIQWDTIGHLVMDQYVREPTCWVNTISAFEKSCKFYNENDSTSDYVAACYTNGCYSKLLEIQKFQVKVANSFQKSSYETERQLFNFMLVRHKNVTTTPPTTPAQLISICKAQINSTDPLNFNTTSQVFDSFSFNQDKSIYDSFNPSTFKPSTKQSLGTTSLYLDTDNYNQSTLLLSLKNRRQILNILYSISSTPIDLLNLNSIIEQFEQSTNELLSSNNGGTTDNIDNHTRQLSLIEFKLLYSVLDCLKEFTDEKLKQTTELFASMTNKVLEINRICIESIKSSEFVGTDNSVTRAVRMLVSSYLEPITWFSQISLLINSSLPSKRAKKKEEYHTTIRTELESIIKLLMDQSQDFNLLIVEKLLSKLSLDTITDQQKQLYGLSTNKNSDLINKSTIVKNVIENSTGSINEIQQYLKTLKTLLNFSINNTNNATA